MSSVSLHVVKPLLTLSKGAGPSGLVAAKTFLHNAPQGHFRVSIVDAQHDIGGLWPTSIEDTGRQVHPLMVANQSKHTVHFSDLAWDEGAPQFPLGWQVGQYLKRYAERYLHARHGLELMLGTKVVEATPTDGQGWDVLLRSEQGDERKAFDYLLVASGFFGKPIVPNGLQVPSKIPVIHSSAYRDLQQLLSKGSQGKPRGGKILVVGGQMSGVEIAGTIGTHLSAAVNSPDPSPVEGVEGYTVHHVVQRPIWIFPLFTSPEVKAAPLPLTLIIFADITNSLLLLLHPFYPWTLHRTISPTDLCRSWIHKATSQRMTLKCVTIYSESWSALTSPSSLTTYMSPIKTRRARHI